MNKEELMFKIDQLRKDKMVHALDAMLIILFGTLLIFGLGFVFPLVNPYVVIKWIVVVAAVAFVYALGGNVVRWIKLMKLEKQLYGQKVSTQKKGKK
jgi:hypothetical protein